MPGSSEVGFDAGWRVEFRSDTPTALAATPACSFDRSGYDAEITVDADGSARAPTFSVAIDGLSDADYQQLVGGPCPIVTISLGWRDKPGSLAAVGANLLAATGLAKGGAADLTPVLTGRVTSVRRTAGDFRYRTELAGIDAAWARLRAKPVGAATLPEKGAAVDYVRALTALVEPPVEVVAEGDHPTLDGTVSLRVEDNVLDAIQGLVRAAYPRTAREHVPLVMRDGQLHVGVWEQQLTGGARHVLDRSTGLVEAVPAPHEGEAPVDGNPYAPVTRDAFIATLLGRADIRVGDQVVMAVPSIVPDPATSAAGSVLGKLGPVGVLAAPIVGLALGTSPATPPRDFRVVGVTHTLGRSAGFTTRLRVEAVKTSARPAAGGEAHRVAEDIDARLQTVARSRRAVDVGIVTAQAAEGTAERHAQRVDLLDGLAETPPPNAVVMGDIADRPTRLVDKPYLTPFAFGATGLVVPHYPGTRVVQLNHEGDPRNAVVAGCVWPKEDAPDSHLGDWWLTLPTGVSPADSSDSPSATPTGEVSSDLIDAAGGRSIHVRGLEITVGRSLMPQVGERPADAAPDEVVIRSDKGKATISIDADGNITISTQKEIHLTADKVVMKAPNGVEVIK